MTFAQILRRAPRRDKGDISRVHGTGVETTMSKSHSGHRHSKGEDHK